MNLNHQKTYNLEIRSWVLQVIEKSHRLARGELVERSCPLCGSKALSKYVHNGAFRYDRCHECSLVFQNPTVSSAMVDEGFEGGDPLLETYFKMMMRYKTTPPARPDPTQHNKIRDIYSIKQSGTLLDVGCSVGDFLHLAKHFYEVEGVEINPVTSEVARRDFTIYSDYLSNLNLSPQYDIITLNQILYGVPDPLSVVKDIRRILKDDGILYINTPNSDSFASKTFQGKCCHYYGYTSLNVFNIDSLKVLAEMAGMQIVSLRTEWLDIYTPDLIEYYQSPENFIHKRNCHRPDYEEQIAAEDELFKRFPKNLGNGGNYIVAILSKSDGAA